MGPSQCATDFTRLPVPFTILTMNNQHLANQLFKSVPSLDETNWYQFDYAIRAYLGATGQQKFLLEEPPSIEGLSDADKATHPTKLAAFEAESNTILSLLLLKANTDWSTTLSQEGFTLARPAYEFLKTSNVKVLEHKRTALRRSLNTLKMLPGESVASYVDNASATYNTLLLMKDSIFTTKNRQMVLDQIINGLPLSWNSTVERLQHENATGDADAPPRTIQDLKGELVRIETQANARPTTTQPPPASASAIAAAFAAMAIPNRSRPSRPDNGKRCTHPSCLRPFHTAAECHKKFLEENPGKTMDDAHRHAQLARLAHKETITAGRQRANQAFSELTPNSYSAEQLAQMLLDLHTGSSQGGVLPSEKPWCIDSGTNSHISKTREGLDNYIQLEHPMKVLFAGDTTGDIVGIGTKRIPTPQGGFTLQRVLHVPALVENLLSVAEFWRQKIGVHFDPDNDIVKFVKQGTLIMTASFRNGLFYLDTTYHARAATAVGAVPFLDAHYWHQKLGHVSYIMLARMKRANLLPDTCTVSPEEFMKASHVVCEACLKGRGTRDGRSASTTLVPRTCYILHADVLVLPTHDIQGNKYSLCVVDGFTSKSVAVPMKHKSDVKSILPNILAMYERQSGLTVLRVRTDRGGEFINEYLNEYFLTKGILYEHTAGYSSESNGVAERLNRTLMDKARSMIKAAGLPDSYWGWALVMANQLSNWIPVNTKYNKTSPHEAFHHAVPDLSFLQPFGATAYVHVPKALRKKLDDHVEIGTLIGFAEPIGSHTYIVRLSNGAIRTSRDVKFATVHDARTTVNAPPADAGTPADAGDADDSDVECDYDADDTPVDAVPQVNEPQLPAPPQPPAPPHVPPQLAPPQPPAPPHAPPQPPAAAHAPPQLPLPPHPPAQQQPPAPPQHGALPPTQASERLLTAPRIRKPIDRYVAHRVGSASPLSELATHTPAQPPGRHAYEARAARPPVPTSYRDATHPDRADRELWIEAMHSEYNSLVGFQAWELIPRTEVPAGKHAIGCRWTYARKADGRYKARLVAQGFSQRPGLDYDDTFAPTSKLSTLRTFLSIVASHDLECRQLDVSTAFLHAPIDGEVYMRQPEGFAHNAELVCRLLRALYGLKQAGRLWHQWLRDKLIANGFKQSEADPSLYLLTDADGTLQAAVLVYVDDCKFAGRTKEITQGVKELIMSLFTCVDLGESRLFLGIEISRDRAARTLTISQNAMVDTILSKYVGAFDVRPRKVPMQPTLKLSKDGEPMDAPQELYGSMLGAIMYVANGTRPDIAYATHRLARYTQNPKQQHWEALLYLLGYLLRYPHVGITYGPEQSVHVYSDADHAGDWDTSRSTAGYAVIVNGGMTSWRSRIQASAAKSTCEAEYRASNATACEVLWYNKLLPELGQPLTQPININCDNQSAESLLKNPQSTEQSKYFRIFWHFGRDAQQRGELTFSYIKSSSNVADPFTKALPEAQLLRLMELGGVHIKGARRPA